MTEKTLTNLLDLNHRLSQLEGSEKTKYFILHDALDTANETLFNAQMAEQKIKEQATQLETINEHLLQLEQNYLQAVDKLAEYKTGYIGVSQRITIVLELNKKLNATEKIKDRGLILKQIKQNSKELYTLLNSLY